MHASIPTTCIPLVFLCVLFFFFLFSLFFLFFLSTSLSFRSSSLSLFIDTHFLDYLPWWDLPFLPINCFGSLWVSFQDYPLTCRLLSHYHCSKCVGCTTLHSQTKLLVLFLTSLYFSLHTSRLGLSLFITYLYSMHQVVLAYTYLF